VKALPKDLSQLLQVIGERFKVNPEGFNPISTWFSYGSNLFKQDFERKMIDRGSYLSLLRARPARLEGWKRRLDNESTSRGLAYSIKKGERGSVVDGVLHDVPIGDLTAFLQFEGILDHSYHMKNDEGKRRYDIEKVKVRPFNGDDIQSCFTLVGRCLITEDDEREKRIRKYREDLMKYVRTSIKGAIDFGLDIVPFQEDLRWIETIR